MGVNFQCIFSLANHDIYCEVSCFVLVIMS